VVIAEKRGSRHLAAVKSRLYQSARSSTLEYWTEPNLHMSVANGGGYSANIMAYKLRR